MNNILIIAAKAVLPFALILAASNLLQGQTTTKEKEAGLAPTSNTQTVNAQQAGSWTVGIDQAKNAVKVSSTDSEPPVAP